MVRFNTTFLLFFLLFSVSLLLQFHPTAPDEGGQHVNQNNYPEKPLLSRILMDTISVLRKSQESSWEKFKTVIHDLQMQFSPPNLDFRGGDDGGPRNVKGKMIDAAEKSFGTSKETVEETARSAGKAVGEAIHKTTEKVTHTDSHKESQAEL
ncbi:hypothetical protein PIB30_055590 [Stylosanthes scabra]|uniref:Uncharacterized protein n=1 Tax=Stylosanthes scabra TaxID=79078 RepID=A0ABU6TK07_9FABA|nr:hypothetical protein [Stylosanthes scabra]